MYGMVVVDDKEDIICGIEKLGEWEQFGVGVVGTASNGEEALEVIKILKPRILITDIRMPIMDGLELTKKVKEFDPDIKIILISGFNEFVYAQQAIKLGAQEYLLKPVSIEDIRDAVKRAVECIILEEKKFLDSIKLKQKLMESLPLLKDQFYSYLVYDDVKDIVKMEEKLDYLGIGLNTHDFMVMIFLLDDYESIIREYSFMDYNLLTFSIINILEETFAEFYKCVVFNSGKSEITAILNVNPEESEVDVSKIADICRKRINEYLKISVSIGIGRYYQSPDDIHISYKEASTAAQNRFLIGKNSIINICDVDIGTNIKFEYPFNLEKELIQYIEIGAAPKAAEVFENFIAQLYNKNSSHPKLIKKYLSQFIIVLSKELAVHGLIINEMIGNEFDYINRLELYQTLDEIRDELKKAVIGISDYITNLRGANERNNIDKISEYISLNYLNDISLNDISKAVFMSPSYLSALIKEHFGESFIERITRLRIEQAKLLLLSSDDKVYEVAEKVGYSDRRYFSDLFRKYTGFTPKEYSEKYKNHIS